MKKLKFAVLALMFALVAMPLPAQKKNILQARLSVVTVEDEEHDKYYEVFGMDVDGQRQYYLTLGQVGVGNHVIQFNVDPVSEMFIYLGETLEESQKTMEGLIALFSQPVNTVAETKGSLAIISPNPEPETIQVAHVKALITHSLEFSVMREEWVRAAYIEKMDLKSLNSSLKLYRKMHKKEK